MSSDVNACGLCNDGLGDVLIIFKGLNNVFIKFQLKFLAVIVVVILTIKLTTQSLTKYESPKSKTIIAGLRIPISSTQIRPFNYHKKAKMSRHSRS